jgi:hypothetical protein
MVFSLSRRNWAIHTEREAGDAIIQCEVGSWRKKKIYCLRSEC